MAKQNPLQALLGKPLTRREFLQHLGILVLAFFGIAQVIQHLTKHDPQAVLSSGRRWGNGKFGS